VMNTKAEVMQAWEDFQKGRLGTTPTQKMPDVHGAPTTLQEG
jgi:quercetin 2,3-dioxygenase